MLIILINTRIMQPSLVPNLCQPSQACLKRLYLTVMNPSAKYPCYSCCKDISNHTTIFTNEHFFCVGCFAKMTETTNYYVLSKLSFPIVEDDWTAKEELLLLEGIEKHYFGNWADIAKHIDTDKSPEDVENHYLKFYIEAEDSMPKLNHEIRPINYKALGQRKFGAKLLMDDQASSERPSRLKPVKNKPKLHQSIAEILGYNAKREDFEIEYDNDAEMLVADMEFNEEDTAEERNLKFRILEIFNRRIDERAKRKKFVIERNLINLEHLSLQEKDKSKPEKEVYAMMRPFARFHAPEDHEKLVTGIIKSRNIRLTIEELKFYKEKGFTNMAQIENELKKKTKKPRGTESRTRRSTADSSSLKRARMELRESELRLCRELGMEKESYAMVKEVIIRESTEHGILEMQSIRKMFTLKRKVLDKIVAELVKNSEIIEPN